MSWLAQRALGAWNVGHALTSIFVDEIDRDLGQLYREVCEDIEHWGAEAARIVGLARARVR